MSRELVIDPNREGSHYGTCEDEKVGGDAEAAARKDRDEAADEGRWREGCSASVRASAQNASKSILETPRRNCRGVWYNLGILKERA